MRIEINTIQVQIVKERLVTAPVLDEAVAEGSTVSGIVKLKEPELSIFCKIDVFDFWMHRGAIYIDNMEQIWRADTETSALLVSHEKNSFYDPEALAILQKTHPEK